MIPGRVIAAGHGRRNSSEFGDLDESSSGSHGCSISIQRIIPVVFLLLEHELLRGNCGDESDDVLDVQSGTNQVQESYLCVNFQLAFRLDQNTYTGLKPLLASVSRIYS